VYSNDVKDDRGNQEDHTQNAENTSEDWKIIAIDNVDIAKSQTLILFRANKRKYPRQRTYPTEDENAILPSSLEQTIVPGTIEGDQKAVKTYHQSLEHGHDYPCGS
jgi:hypothetical protein